MPVRTRKLSSGKFRNTTPGGVKAKGTTKANAEAQKRLLNAIENNPNFVPRKTRKTRKTRKKRGFGARRS